MIYTIREGKTERVKVGYTRNKASLRTRLRSLQTSNSELLYVEATMPGSKYKERRLHSKLINRHIRGEWFRLTPDEVKRMVAKFADWKPNRATDGTASEIRHLKKGLRKVEQRKKNRAKAQEAQAAWEATQPKAITPSQWHPDPTRFTIEEAKRLSNKHGSAGQTRQWFNSHGIPWTPPKKWKKKLVAAFIEYYGRNAIYS